MPSLSHILDVMNPVLSYLSSLIDFLTVLPNISILLHFLTSYLSFSILLIYCFFCCYWSISWLGAVSVSYPGALTALRAESTASSWWSFSPSYWLKSLSKFMFITDCYGGYVLSSADSFSFSGVLELLWLLFCRDCFVLTLSPSLRAMIVPFWLKIADFYGISKLNLFF